MTTRAWHPLAYWERRRELRARQDERLKRQFSNAINVLWALHYPQASKLQFVHEISEGVAEVLDPHPVILLARLRHEAADAGFSFTVIGPVVEAIFKALHKQIQKLIQTWGTRLRHAVFLQFVRLRVPHNEVCVAAVIINLDYL